MKLRLFSKGYAIWENILSIILIAVAFQSCEKVEKIENFGEITPKLIVNGVAEVGSPLFFYVHKSLSVLDNAPMKSVKNALIKVYRFGVLVDTAILQNDVYVCQKIAVKPGDQFSIQVSAPGLDPVSAETVVPAQVVTKDLTVEIKDRNVYSSGSGYRSGTFESGKLRFAFDDNGNERNYYVLKIYENWVNGSERSRIDWTCLRPGVEGIRNYSSASGFDGYSYFFDDAVGNGNEISLEFITTNSYNPFLNSKDSIISFECKLYAVTEDYSKHLYTIALTEENQWNPFQEPVQVFSNVQNGYGIFGSRSWTGRSVQFPY